MAHIKYWFDSFVIFRRSGTVFQGNPIHCDFSGVSGSHVHLLDPRTVSKALNGLSMSRRLKLMS